MSRWIFLIGVLLASSAEAHLMSRGHGTLNVVKGKAYIVLSFPISVFSESAAHDAVVDGILTAQELKAHEQGFRAAIRTGFTVHHGEAEVTFSTILLNLPKGDHHTPNRSTELTAMIVAPLGSEQGRLNPLKVAVQMWGKDARSLKLKATVTTSGQTERSEVFEFTPSAPRHRFFSKATEPAPR